MVCRSTTRATTARAINQVTGSGGGADGESPPTFDVSTLDGLCAWFDFSDNSTVLNAISPDTPATNGQTVRRILDKSGNAKHANQATGLNQGLFVTGAANGRGVLRLDGTNDFYTCGAIGDWNFLHNGTSSLVVAVLKAGTTSNPDAGYTIIDTGGAVPTERGYFFATEDRSAFSRNNGLNVFVSSGASPYVIQATNNDVLTFNAVQVIENAIDADSVTLANRSKSIVNGGSEFGANALAGTASASNSTYALQLGRSAASGGILYFTGDFCELIICNQANVDKRADLRAALAYKWGATLA